VAGGAQALDPNPHTADAALSFISPSGSSTSTSCYLANRGRRSPAQLQHHIVGAESAPFYLFARIVGALIGTATSF